MRHKGRSIERVHCVHIRRLRATRAAAASTRQQTSYVNDPTRRARRFATFVRFVIFVIFVGTDMTRRTLLPAFVAIGAVWTTAVASAATCESLATLSLPNTKVTTSQQVAPGTFTPPGAQGPNGPAPVFAK